MGTNLKYLGVNLTSEQQAKLVHLMSETNQTQTAVIRQLIDLAHVGPAIKVQALPAIKVQALPAVEKSNGAMLVSDPAGAVAVAPI